MYAGHIGIALGAHGIRRGAPLWFLIIASQLPDWADAGFCLVGVRPAVQGILSHSLPAALILALFAAIVYAIINRDAGGMLLVAAVVLSHVATDYLTGLKPTWTGGPMIGLMLYKKPLIDFVLESGVIFAGWMLYRRSLAPERRSAEPVYTLLAAMLLIQAGADIVLIFAEGMRKC